MAGHDLIVVGASAGGLEALQQLVRGLPADVPASVCIVQHILAESPDLLAALLDRAGPLSVTSGHDGMPIQNGQIVVAPPDQHLLVEQGRLRLSHGPKENRHRPSIDALFRSAALAYGPRVIGVILTGRLDDGTAGLLAVKQCGGLALVQDPRDARYPDMPQSALRHVAVDVCVPLSKLAGELVKLVSCPVVENIPSEPFPWLSQEVEIAAMDEWSLRAHPTLFGVLSPYSCPECGGVLQERQEGSLRRFRCYVGHAFSVETLLEEQLGVLERELRGALKTVRERGHLVQRLSEEAQQAGASEQTNPYAPLIQETQQRLSFLERVLWRGDKKEGQR